MQNINISENKTLSSSSAAVSIIESTSMKPQDSQLKRESASQKVSGMTIKRSYGSMPNLTPASLTTGRHTTAILQAPTAVTIQLVSTEPIAFYPTSIELANYSGQRIRKLPTAEVENGSPFILSDYLAKKNVSGIQKKTEPLAFAYCPTPIKLTNYDGPQMRYHIALVMRLRLAATFVSGVHWFLFRREPILYLDLAKG